MKSQQASRRRSTDEEASPAVELAKLSLQRWTTIRLEQQTKQPRQQRVHRLHSALRYLVHALSWQPIVDYGRHAAGPDLGLDQRWEDQ